MSKTSKIIIVGQPSWRITSSTVQAYLTEQGGHLAPIVYDRRGQKIQPHTTPLWAKEKLPRDLPQILKVLRGDFFCMPFGGNETPYGKEKHPPHGETANLKWKLVNITKNDAGTTLHARMKTRIRPATVDKQITLIDGHNAVYSKHTIAGMKGTISLGHHATLRCPDQPGSGLISTSPMKYGMVTPLPVELPEKKGYSILDPGTKFSKLNRVRMITGKYTDLTSYPARRGFEDIVMLVAKPRKSFAWTAMTFPKERYVWFALKDPQVLKQTLLWMSNGGRYFPPWNGRHVNVIGIEDVTSYFHYGLAESARTNSVAKGGDPTCLKVNPEKPVVINYIMSVAKIPQGFDRVKSIEPVKNSDTVVLTARSGRKVEAPVDYSFLKKC